MNRKADVRALVILLLAMLLGLVFAPPHRAEAMTPDDIFTMRTVGLNDLDAAGARLLYTVTAWNPESRKQESTLYLRDLESGRELLLLTPADQAWGAGWRPDGEVVSYLRRTEAGTEAWLMDPDGGGRRRLTRRSTEFGALVWAPDASAVAWISPADEGAYNGKPDRWIIADDLGYRHLGEGYRQGHLRQAFVLDLGTDEIRRIAADSLDVRQLAWSPDSRSLVLTAKRRRDLNRTVNTDLWLVGRAGANLRPLTRNPGADDHPCWLPDGRLAYLRATDPLGESAPRAVAVIDPEVGDAGDPELFGTGFDNMVRNLVVLDDRLFIQGAVRGCLDVLEIRGEQAIAVTDGGHDYWAMRVAGSRLVLAGAGQTLPSAMFVVDLAEKIKGPHHPRIIVDPNREWRQRVGLVDPEPFVVEVEGRQIEGWYYKPQDLDPDQLAPAVLSIHGGPEWMYGGYFLPEFHILPTFGYGVIIANPTGSSGYGYEFQTGVRGDWVGRPARELLACVDAAVKEGWADPGALAVMGGSYGGHLAAELTTQTDRFRAAAVDRMFPDLEAFWGTTDEKWFPEWEFYGRPWEPAARDIYRRNSPTSRLGRVATPTLISQGMEDYRCLIAGGEMWFSGLRARGVPSRFIRFLHEGHGIRDPRDQVFYQWQLLAFFDQHVLGLDDEEREVVPDTLEAGGFPRGE